ncbi:MAG TPA: hypothetical protein VJ721_07540 [Chthoniobacterales bacterium]|nr:hypothetical protein [Chthoniobacterales bacterium]
MKTTHSTSSINTRATMGAVLILSAIGLLCIAPIDGSYAAKSKQNFRSAPVQGRAEGRTMAAPNTGPTPASGSVNASGSQTASWDGTTISPGGNQNTDTTCMDNSPVFGCETFTLTVNGTQADWAGKKVQVLLTWTSVANEYDIHIHKGSNAGPLITSAFEGPGLTNQVAYIDASNLTTDSAHPTTVFTVHVAYDTTPASATDPYHGSVTPVSTTATSIAAAPQDTGPKVGFENFEAPGVLVPASALSSGGITVEYLGRGAGEPSIGANWVTGVVNFQSDLQTEFITFNDSCDLTSPKAIWLDRRAPTSQFIDSDPIGFTDHTSGTANRVFASELTLVSPDTVKISHSDDDGVTWVPDQSGGVASAVDHQTIGGGPYHAPLINPVYPHAIYYASQDIAFASISRSDDGGLTYGPSVQMYTINQCSGLHGHIKVAPDGTVYVPNRACGNVPILNGGNTAVVVSTDNGLTWTIKPVLNGSVTSSAAPDDPAVAIDTAGKIYCLFALNGTTAAVGVSDNQGTTWKNIYDVGAGLGLTNVAFPAAIGGDAGRAAVAFYASKGGAGDSNDDNYTGVWHLYVAETFDGGDHWTTTDVTPYLPMQRMGLLRGGGGPIDRNLLDFFDMTIDKDGRVLVGYVNGCSGGDCSQAPVNPDGSTSVTGNTYSATASIARQSSGRRLSGNQPAPVSVPGMPFVTVRRVGPVVHLAWNEADPGFNGTDQTITNYQIFRGTSPGGENATPIATIGGTLHKFDDMTATNPSVTYYYKVVANNSIGSSCPNNEVAAPFVGDTCSGMIIHRNLPSHPEALGGSETGVPVGPTPSPTPSPTATPPIPPQYLIDYIAVAEPPSKPGKLLFQMKVTNLTSVPANSRWRMVWNSISTPDEQYFVGMTTDASSAVSFEYGTVQTETIPPVVGVIGVPIENPVGTPDAASNFNADGTISIYIDKSLVGNPQPGDILGAVNGRTFNTGDTPPQTLERSTLLVDHTFIKGNTDNSFPAATYTITGNSSCTSTSIAPVGAVSRKTHGTAGDFDINLPLAGQPGIEDRTGATPGTHKVIVTFAVPVTVTSATVSPGAGGTATVDSFSVNNTEVTINLTNVSNAQTLTVNLLGVSGGGNSGDVGIPMGVLLGDTNADRFTDAVDTSITKSQSGRAVGLDNFREDVNSDGFIDATDTAIVKSKSGTALP